ncbi:symplekin [Phthorimaea operculella]|nr:symplekin [Phthorimaea operculella]
MTTKQNIAAQNQLVQWINEAGMADGGKKAGLLRKIIEVLLHQASNMIPVYLENILSYVSDKFPDVKKQVVGFIEEISKQHPEHIPKCIGQLRLLIIDSVIAVQKRAIQAASIVYRNTLIWMCKTDCNMNDLQYVWQNLSELKLIVLNMIDSDNEGIRTHSIKFLEEVVLLQTPGEGNDEGFHMDDLPKHLPFIKRNALDEEAEHIFTLLVKFHNSQHISSVNLMACMTTLCLLAKFRPKFMGRVIQALGDLHTTLPPTLSQSQVNSVRKHLKMLLVNIIKHPSSTEMLPQLTQLLLDIGMTAQEINKAIPKERRNKRIAATKGTVSEESIFDGLDKVDNVVRLVMSTLLNNLPNDMPSTFISEYKPIPNAGSKAQKKELAKMMLALIKNEPFAVPKPPEPVPPPSLSEIAAKIPLIREDDEKTTLKNAVAKLQHESTKVDKKVEHAVSKLMEETRAEHLKEEERRTKEKEKLIPPPTPTVPKLKQKVKLLKLQEITRPIPKEIKEKLMIRAVHRILRAEKDAAIGGAAQIRAKFISIFASSYTPEIRDLVLNYILEDPADRIDLAMNWLYEEYAFMQGFNRHPVTLQPKVHEKHDQNYNQLLCALITQIFERGEPHIESCKDVLFRKIYSEAPVITDEAVDYLKHLVTEEKVAMLALELLEELCIMRPPRAHKYVPSLVCHVLSPNADIRDTALKSALKIYNKGSDAVKRAIEKHAMLYLGFISCSCPPSELLGGRSMRMPWTDELYNICLNLVVSLFPDNEDRCPPSELLGGRSMRMPWTDELYNICLNLVVSLFPDNEDLIMEIARVYGCCTAEGKRCVLRAIEGPLRHTIAMGAGEGHELRPAFEALLDECPRGAETLLTRLVHLLTEKAPPSPELVCRVRELYATRVSDVRFLIPVLSGLSKKEILAALPKLIKLNPAVVKEVFNKLLGAPTGDNSPISPTELLVALHLIDPALADLKNIIKATALCFAEKHIYTQDVVSAALQRLSGEPEIPVLLMRSVLQALTLYPSTSSLALNILELLIEREVWQHKVAWEGWIKVCSRLLPASCALLCALPARPLQAALMACPQLTAALSAHLGGMSTAERALLPPHVISIGLQQQPTVQPPEQMSAADGGMSTAERALLPPHVISIGLQQQPTVQPPEQMSAADGGMSTAERALLPHVISIGLQQQPTVQPPEQMSAADGGMSTQERALLPPHVISIGLQQQPTVQPPEQMSAADGGMSTAERALLPPHVISIGLQQQPTVQPPEQMVTIPVRS